MKFTVDRSCEHCNKGFIVKTLTHNPNAKASIVNFENCPHCGKRNDIWVKINWPDQK